MDAKKPGDAKRGKLDDEALDRVNGGGSGMTSCMQCGECAHFQAGSDRCEQTFGYRQCGLWQNTNAASR